MRQASVVNRGRKMAQGRAVVDYSQYRVSSRGARGHGVGFGVKSALMTGLYALAAVYLVYHTFNGDRGLYALLKENRKLDVIGEELEKVRTQRASLEHDAKLLRPESLDIDMLDEQVRANLGVAGQDELLVLDGGHRPAP